MNVKLLRNTNTLLTTTLCLLLLGTLNSPAVSSSIVYADVQSASGNMGTPSNTYSAASPLAGVWNPIPAFPAGPHPLLDTTGNPSGASVTITPSGSGFFNWASTVGDNQSLLDDYVQATAGIGNSLTYTISGLAEGLYVVFTYAWRADTSADVVVNGLPAEHVQADPSGVFNGFIPGETHSEHTVFITAGQNISITVTTTDDTIDQAHINGFQIVPEAIVPTKTSTWGLIKELYK